MTRDQEQFRLPKLPFVFEFVVNTNWHEAYEECRRDGWFSRELPDCEEDLETILKSVSIVFTDCSAKKLSFLAKAYMIFVHLLESPEWEQYETTESKIDYLKQCFDAYQKNDERQLKELNAYLHKLVRLFKDYQDEQRHGGLSNGDRDEPYSVDSLMEGLINSLNEIMLRVECEHEELHQASAESVSMDERISSYLAHNVNHYDVILAKLFFNQQMISPQIEQDKLYCQLKNCISKAIGIMNDIYSFPIEHQFPQADQMNFIMKLSEWLSVSISQALQMAPDYVDEQLQKFEGLCKQLIDKYGYKTAAVYIEFWKKMYIAALLFCTQTPRYSRYFAAPIQYKFLEEKFSMRP